MEGGQGRTKGMEDSKKYQSNIKVLLASPHPPSHIPLFVSISLSSLSFGRRRLFLGISHPADHHPYGVWKMIGVMFFAIRLTDIATKTKSAESDTPDSYSASIS